MPTLNVKVDPASRTFDLGFNTALGDPYYFDVRSLVYNYRLVGRGTVLNADVCQMITPAGLRAEHPLATIVGWCLNDSPNYNSMQLLADYLSHVQGAFAFVGVNSTRDRALACNKGVGLCWDNEHGDFSPDDAPEDYIALLSVEDRGRIDSLDIPIRSPQGVRKLFVVESFKDDWTLRWRRPTDYKVSYAQIDYKTVHTHQDKGRSGPWYLNLVARCLAYALDFPTADVPSSLVLGLGPKDCDLLLIGSLARVVYAATAGHIQLEVPLYEQSIGHRITQTY